MEILFLDSSPSSHHERFVELFSTLGNVHSVFVDLLQEPPFLKFELVVFADLDLTVDYVMEFACPKIGLSWAWDLQQTLRKGPEIKKKLGFALSVLDLLIVDCLTVEKTARKFGLREDKIFRAPYGIQIEDYPLRKNREPGTGKLRLYTNRRWEKLYRPQIILEMARELSNSKVAFELILANDGSLRQHLLKQYSSLFENGLCIWLGKISQRQNVIELENADIYISASSSDGSSLSMLEAMAIGVPTLVTDNPENREWITDNSSGYLFSGNSGHELALKIRSIDFEQTDQAKLVKKSREKVLHDANWNQTRELLLKKVQEISREH